MPQLIKPFEMTFPVPNDEHKAELTVRHLMDGELADISSHCSETKLTYLSKDKVYRNTTIDNAKETVSIVSRAVPKWKNFLDTDGNKMECTPANIKQFVHQGWFLPFVENCRQIVKDEFDKKHGEALKNLSALLPGSQEQDGKAVKSVA